MTALVADPAAGRQYLLATAAYWAFTLTDGALRMVVLLHFHELGYSPIAIAMLFVLYEVAGVVTNLIGGWWGARSGLGTVLAAGLGVQIVALGLLSLVGDGWAAGVSVGYVMVVQALSGVAKDLVKTAAKSTTKFVASGGGLFAVVALLTGSKNALKGVGFFVGAALLGWIGYRPTLWLLVAVVVPALIAVAIGGTADLGRAKAKPRLASVLSPSPAVNRLSIARFFLFAGRDIWFVVALPVFLSQTLGWSHQATGGFLAAWVIGYGIVQALTPRIVSSQTAWAAARFWVAALAVGCAVLAALVTWGRQPGLVVTVGLAAFGFVFAVNSSLHSYLIVELASADGTSADVGFYYSANATGRLVGTLLSGLLATVGGLDLALWGSALFTAAAFLATLDPKPRARP